MTILNKYFIVIGGGYHQLSLIKEIKKIGYKLILVDINENAPGFRYADYIIVHNSYDFKGVYILIKNIAKDKDIVGVITQAARGAIATTAYLAEKFNTRWLNFKTAQLTINKIKISELFNKKISIPSLESVKKLPIVIKDQRYSGSTGVYKINNMNELNLFRNRYRDEELRNLVIEKYVNGRHLIVFGFKKESFTKVYGIGEKFINQYMKTNFVLFPGKLGGDLNRLILKYTRNILKKLKFNFGPFMIELIVDKNGEIFIAEIEASLQGSHFSDFMIPSITDSSPILDTINSVLGKRINRNVKMSNLFYAQKYYYTERSGEIEKIEIFNCSKEIILFPHIDNDFKINNEFLFFFNAVLIGDNRHIEEIFNKLNKCELKIRYKS